MAQERYLSPKNILSYLCDLENKLPKRDYKLYKESHRHDDDFGRVTPQEMNDECQRMLEFVGMGGYKADARFATLDEGTAGRTVPGHKPSGKVPIEVSDSMTGNWKAVIATLAHEICHHVIYDNFIRPMASEVTEAYTDLCTIYVGFGQLILDGYKTNVRREQRTLGYLDWNTYEVTNHMVNVVRGGVPSGNTGLKDSDVFADEAIQIWESEEKRNNLMKEAFEKRSATLTETMRNIAYLESLLSIYRERLMPRSKEMSQLFEKMKESMQDGANKSLKTFSSLYDDYLLCHDNNETDKDGVLEAALYNLYNNVQKRVGAVELERDIICQGCGKRYKLGDDNGSKRIIKCKQCGTYFVVDTTDWNPTVIQRREEQKRIEKRKKQESELEALRIKVSGEEKSAAWKECNQLKQNLDNINAGISRMPGLFRWVLNQYVKER